MRKRANTYALRSIPAVLILSALYLVPLSFIFLRAFDNGAEALKEVFTSPYTYKLLSFSIKQALLSAAISVLASLPFAAFFSKYTFPGRSLILALSSLSFTMPAILVVLGFVIFYGNNGFLNRALMSLFGLETAPLKILYSYTAIIFAHVYLNFPVSLSLLTGAWSGMSDREEYASYLMGKGRIRTFLSITLPKLKGTLISAFGLIFLFSFSSFMIVLVLGGKPSYYTLEAEIYKRTYTDLAPSSSASLSIFVFVITTIFLLLISGGERLNKRPRGERILIKARRGKILKAFLLCALILLFILPPMLSIVYRAFFDRDGIFTLEAWENIMQSSIGLESSSKSAIINSLLIALTSALASVKLAESIVLYSARKNSKLLPVLSSLPLATGSVTLGLGFSFAASYIPSSSILASYLLVFFSHLVITLPFAVRTLLPGARRIPTSMINASLTLGASERRTIRRIEIPELTSYRRKAFAFAFALSLGEVNATLTLAEGRVVTLPILLYRMISSYNYQGASALGTILLIEALIFFLIGEKGNRNATS